MSSFLEIEESVEPAIFAELDALAGRVRMHLQTSHPGLLASAGRFRYGSAGALSVLAQFCPPVRIQSEVMLVLSVRLLRESDHIRCVADLVINPHGQVVREMRSQPVIGRGRGSAEAAETIRRYIRESEREIVGVIRGHYWPTG